MFDWDGTDWVQRGSDLDGQPEQYQGSAVAISADANTIAVGAEQFHDGRCCEFTPGRVRVYDWDGTDWAQRGDEIEGRQILDFMGSAVAISADGNTVAMGAPDRPGIGYVRVVDWIGGAWEPRGEDLATGVRFNQFGAAVAISADGNTIAAGAPGFNPSAVSSGPAFVQVFRSAGAVLCNNKAVTIDMNVTGSGTGTPGDDVILGTPGDDFIYGLGGNDTICAGDGYDWIFGGDGEDELFGGLGIDIMFGEAGDDIMNGTGGSDYMWGGAGIDMMWGDSGADRIHGGPGDDELFGQGGKDLMWGDEGNDVMKGMWQSDRMWGGPGDDIMEGSRGKDIIYGEAGNDMMYGGVNADFLDGGDGIDAAFGQKGKDNPLEPGVTGCIAETKNSC